jgi:uncharacterized protein DUF6879
MHDLGWWLQNFQRSAFRLETLPEYSVPQEAEMLAAFKRGERVDLPDDHPWLLRVRRHTAAGRQMRRVRVVSYPLTDYLRMEMSWYPKSAIAGEDIRIANLNENPELTTCSQDFWLFDDSTALKMVYDSTGRFVDIEPGDVNECRRQVEIALSCSMELSAYTARTART